MNNRNFEAAFAVSGQDRKKLVEAISEIVLFAPVYCGAPTFNYVVGNYTITKDGTVTATLEDGDSTHKTLMEKLQEQGFNGTVLSEPSEAAEPTEEKGIGLTVTVPAEHVNVPIVAKLIEAKKALTDKAFGITEYPIESCEEGIRFPWFKNGLTPEEVRAYTDYIAALCKISNQLQRVNTSTTEIKNEKYTFRCFLLRLGLIGDEYKQTRKILLRNLEGSSAFRNGRPEVQNDGE